jgi:hypothetical protein
MWFPEFRAWTLGILILLGYRTVISRALHELQSFSQSRWHSHGALPLEFMYTARSTTRWLAVLYEILFSLQCLGASIRALVRLRSQCLSLDHNPFVSMDLTKLAAEGNEAFHGPMIIGYGASAFLFGVITLKTASYFRSASLLPATSLSRELTVFLLRAYGNKDPVALKGTVRRCYHFSHSNIQLIPQR